jgi:hypothetical protein
MSDYSEGQGIGSKRVLLRMADANRNRVMEGLRTLEDLARFSGLKARQLPRRQSLLQE